MMLKQPDPARLAARRPRHGNTPPTARSAGDVSAEADAAQRLGNRALQRLLSSADPVQPRLRIGAVDDPLEHEADRVADRALATPLGSAVALQPALAAIQRRSHAAAASQGPAPASVERTLAEGGQPLPPALQADMAQRLGQDFSDVRVHTGDAAAHSARDIQAHAYTAGRHIVFGAGRYQPSTPFGRRLLAHELAHTVQQGQAAQASVVQCFAIEPTVANPPEVVLTDVQMRTALQFDRVFFTDEAEIGVVRDVLGIAREPAVVDEDFVNTVVRYQAAFGLGADGILGRATAEQLAREVTAWADMDGEAGPDPATGTPLRRTARRLLLRSMVSRTRGVPTHQGFVGDDMNPEGAVTVRVGDRQAGNTNMISLEYTGENASRVNWLQFINIQMFATPPGGTRVFNTGVVGTTGGSVTYSDATTTNWFVDANPATAGPLYNTGFLATRRAGRRLAMFDQPGGPSGLPLAQAFAAPGASAAGATRVTLRMRFDAYAVRADQARYHVAWTATTVYDTGAGTAGNITYAQGSAGAVTALRGVHRTALLAEYAGSAIR